MGLNRSDGAVAAEQFLAGARLKAIRQAKGLSLRDVADRIGGGVHFTTIGKLETGKTKLSVEWVGRIAPALGVAPLEILDEAFSEYSVKAVPIFPIGALEEDDTPEESFRIGYAPTTVGFGDAFAISVHLDLGDAGALNPGFFVVDPFLKGVLDGRTQLLRLSDNSLFVGKFDAGRSVYDRWIGFGESETVAIGATRFHAIGTVVFVGYYP